MVSEGEKLPSLDERIRAAEAKPENKTGLASAGKIGFDFVGSVVGAGLVGAVMDYAFKTGPWCLLGMVIFGFCAGVWSFWRSIQKSEGTE